jgi:hypothetical protein
MKVLKVRLRSNSCNLSVKKPVAEDNKRWSEQQAEAKM